MKKYRIEADTPEELIEIASAILSKMDEAREIAESFLKKKGYETTYFTRHYRTGEIHINILYGNPSDEVIKKFQEMAKPDFSEFEV